MRRGQGKDNLHLWMAKNWLHRLSGNPVHPSTLVHSFPSFPLPPTPKPHNLSTHIPLFSSFITLCLSLAILLLSPHHPTDLPNFSFFLLHSFLCIPSIATLCLSPPLPPHPPRLHFRPHPPCLHFRPHPPLFPTQTPAIHLSCRWAIKYSVWEL